MQLPECLRIIGYLRRIGVFSEYEMRLQVTYSNPVSCQFLLSVAMVVLTAESVLLKLVECFPLVDALISLSDQESLCFSF